MENEALFFGAGALPPGYQARILTETDIPAALALCEGNPLYYEYCPPRPSAENLLATCPHCRQAGPWRTSTFWASGGMRS